MLKWAQGFGGFDIHFVRSAAEAATIITNAYEENEAMREAMPGMGSWIEGMEESDAQPGWVLQSMVPSVLLHGRKIHLRTYVIALRARGAAADRGGVNGSTLEFYAYQRHEVRLAAAPMSDDLTDKNAHLTNGVWERGGTEDPRTTLDATPELDHLNLDPKVMAVLNKLFHSLPFSSSERGPTDSGARGGADRAFGMSGIDVMVTDEGGVYVLELNASPACAPPDTVSEEQIEHLVVFARSLLKLVSSDEPEKVEGFVRVGVNH